MSSEWTKADIHSGDLMLHRIFWAIGRVSYASNIGMNGDNKDVLLLSGALKRFIGVQGGK